MAGWSTDFDWDTLANMYNAPTRCVLDLYAACKERGASMDGVSSDNVINTSRQYAKFVNDGIVDLLSKGWYDTSLGVPSDIANKDLVATDFELTEEAIDTEVGYERPDMDFNSPITSEWVYWCYTALNMMTSSFRKIIFSSTRLYDTEKKSASVVNDVNCISLYQTAFGSASYVAESLQAYYPYVAQNHLQFADPSSNNDAEGYRIRPITDETFNAPHWPLDPTVTPYDAISTYIWWEAFITPELDEEHPDYFPPSTLDIVTAVNKEWELLQTDEDVEANEVVWRDGTPPPPEIQPDTAPLGPYNGGNLNETWLCRSQDGLCLTDLTSILTYY